MRNAEVLNAIANDDFQTELGQFNIEINVPPRAARRRPAPTNSRPSCAPASTTPRSARPGDRRAHRDDRHPADARSRAPHPRVAQRQPAVRADQRADLRGARRGPHIAIDGVERLSTSTDTIAPEAACTSVQFHLQVSPQEYAAHVERRAVHRRRAGRARRELAVPVRQGTVARDADRPVRAGHRHPSRGAQGAGRASAGLVRRAMDHLDLRPVRGERALLPVAAADRRRRGPGRGARPRRHARGSPSCACTTGRSIAGTGRCTTSTAASRTCASRTGCCRPDRRSWTCSPTAPSTTACSARCATRTGRCGRGCRSPRPRTTSTPAPSDGINAQLYWPGLGEVPVTELVLRRLLPLAQAGPGRSGASTPRSATGCSAIIEAPLHRAHATARSGRRSTFHAIDESDAAARPARRAARDAAPLHRAHAHQRAGAHLVDRVGRLRRRAAPAPRSSTRCKDEGSVQPRDRRCVRHNEVTSRCRQRPAEMSADLTDPAPRRRRRRLRAAATSRTPAASCPGATRRGSPTLARDDLAVRRGPRAGARRCCAIQDLDADTTAVDIVTGDAPYLVDSLRAELERPRLPGRAGPAPAARRRAATPTGG